MLARDVRVEFDPRDPAVGPFPTDFLTLPDDRQRTALRVNLPLPDCGRLPADCAEIGQLNHLDGFSSNARLTVKFSGPIDPDSLRNGIFVVPEEMTLAGAFPIHPANRLIPINQVIYDPVTFTAYGKPDEILQGSRRYVLLVTDGVRDASGDPVERDPGFQRCIDRLLGGAYCDRLALAVDRVNFRREAVRGASVFTVVSTTAWLERARDVVESTPTDFRRQGGANVVQAQAIQSVTLVEHVAVRGDRQLRETPVPVPPGWFSLAGVGRIAFGSYQSPRFTGPDGTIPLIPSNTRPTPAGREEIFFHAFLPARPAPAAGYPVLLAGHGLGDSRFGMPTVLSLANQAGYAVVAINAFGNGGGPRSAIRLGLATGTVEFVSGGRSVDLDDDGVIGASEGCISADAAVPVVLRDCFRQTAADYLQLIHAIRDGIDLDGDGRRDLDPSGIQYFGQSLGGGYGALVTALAPEVAAAVLNVAPGTSVDLLRLSPGLRDNATRILLGRRQPSLLDARGGFDEEIPFRYEGVRIRSEGNAAALQDFFERLEWIEFVSPASVAPHWKQSTLPGHSVHRVLIQMALGDRTVPNPSTTLLVRAANLREQTSLYRHDLALALAPDLDPNPHTFLIPLGPPVAQAVGFAALQQAIQFFAGGRETVPDVNPVLRAALGRDLFEIPAALPETPGFLAGR